MIDNTLWEVLFANIGNLALYERPINWLYKLLVSADGF